MDHGCTAGDATSVVCDCWPLATLAPSMAALLQRCAQNLQNV
jgi:trans-aconitate methyltransferase